MGSIFLKFGQCTPVVQNVDGWSSGRTSEETRWFVVYTGASRPCDIEFVRVPSGLLNVQTIAAAVH